MATMPAKRAMMITDLPIEILSHILRTLFLSPFPDSWLPTTAYPTSTLHRRLITYRHIALVHRSFHQTARQIFFETVPCLTVEAIRGLLSAFTSEDGISKDDRIGNRLQSTEASFEGGYQGSVCVPRKPRRRIDGKGTSIGSTRAGAQWEPSIVHLASHFLSFQHDLASLLRFTPSLRSLTLSLSCPLLPHSPSATLTKYNQTWPTPSITDKTLLTALLGCSNLRVLQVVDPCPLETWGVEMKGWKKLDELSITLQTPQMCRDLSSVAFCPPKSLTRFTFIDLVCAHPWPLAADLGGCTDLRHLTLGARSFVGAQTKEAVGFLVGSYQASLESLRLEDHSSSGFGTNSSTRPTEDVLSLLAGTTHFDPSLRLSFPSLTSLSLPLASTPLHLFASVRLPKLQHLRVKRFAEGNGRTSAAAEWVGVVGKVGGEVKRVEVEDVGDDWNEAVRLGKERGIQVLRFEEREG